MVLVPKDIRILAKDLKWGYGSWVGGRSQFFSVVGYYFSWYEQDWIKSECKDPINEPVVRLLEIWNWWWGGTDDSVRKFNFEHCGIMITGGKDSFQKRIGIRMRINSSSNVTAENKVVQIGVIIAFIEGGEGWAKMSQVYALVSVCLKPVEPFSILNWPYIEPRLVPGIEVFTYY